MYLAGWMVLVASLISRTKSCEGSKRTLMTLTTFLASLNFFLIFTFLITIFRDGPEGSSCDPSYLLYTLTGGLFLDMRCYVSLPPSFFFLPCIWRLAYYRRVLCFLHKNTGTEEGTMQYSELDRKVD